MSVTSTGASASFLAAAMPPMPPPTIATLRRAADDTTRFRSRDIASRYEELTRRDENDRVGKQEQPAEEWRDQVVRGIGGERGADADRGEAADAGDGAAEDLVDD